jgi:hypothetical protein
MDRTVAALAPCGKGFYDIIFKSVTGQYASKEGS